MLNPKDWTIAYTGYGKAAFETILVMEPKTSTLPNETHASLVLHQARVKDFNATLEVTNRRALRAHPNAWECFWFFFNYTLDANKKKKCNYIALKTTGIELGTAFDEIGQTFLYTSAIPAMSFGQPFRLNVKKIGKALDVSVNGIRAFTYSPTSKKPIYDLPGQFGLYTEDALVEVSQFYFI